MADLTPKQEKFCIEYLKSGNASAAYRHAFSTEKMKPETVNRNAKALIDDNKIATRLDELRKPVIEKTQLTLERVIVENMNVAFFDIRTILDDDGAVKPVSEWPAAAGAAISSMEVLDQYKGSGKDRVFVGYIKKIKLVDKGSALDRLMKHLGGYEQDNKQKGDALRDFYNSIAGGSLPVISETKTNVIEHEVVADVVNDVPVNAIQLYKPKKSSKKLVLERD